MQSMRRMKQWWTKMHAFFLSFKYFWTVIGFYIIRINCATIIWIMMSSFTNTSMKCIIYSFGDESLENGPVLWFFLLLHRLQVVLYPLKCLKYAMCVEYFRFFILDCYTELCSHWSWHNVGWRVRGDFIDFQFIMQLNSGYTCSIVIYE